MVFPHMLSILFGEIPFDIGLDILRSVHSFVSRLLAQYFIAGSGLFYF
jgi:hypothetical protein